MELRFINVLWIDDFPNSDTTRGAFVNSAEALFNYANTISALDPPQDVVALREDNGRFEVFSANRREE
jgi:hypothetical protein